MPKQNRPRSTGGGHAPSLPRLPYRRGRVRRAMLRVGHLVLDALAPYMIKIPSTRLGTLLVHRPHFPTQWVARLRSPVTPFTAALPSPPDELRTVAGVKRDPAAERRAFEEHPLHNFFMMRADELVSLLPIATIVGSSLTELTRVEKATEALTKMQERLPSVAPGAVDPADLTRRLKEKAADLGISAAGVAQYDEKYTFAEHVGKAVGDRVVVVILEQNYDATQRIPSFRSEQAALSTYSELEDRLVLLSEWLREQGYKARPETYTGESMFIPYAVAAGLGQLGLNGQLLSPHAGSRCRLNMLTTDAPLLFDESVDYGIEGVCNNCQLCVRNCPVGAIPNHRAEHRGVTKAKLNTKRCLPLMVQASGCSICMKVCPVQRYGLGAVLDHYGETGKILGKGTDDLEGYDWPLDGEHYGPGEKPHVPESIPNPPGFEFDTNRTEPPENAPALPNIAM